MSNLSPAPRILDFRSFNTRQNLPAASSTKRGESNFLAKFERAYLDQEIRKSTCVNLASGREFGVDGCGRADVLFLSWSAASGEDDFHALALKTLRLTAIEGKISDWRKGLMQASHYRHFANRSLLVLSPDVCSTALNYIETFRNLQVGLWSFDSKSNRIKKHFTPRHGRALNSKAHEKAMHVISAKLKFR